MAASKRHGLVVAAAALSLTAAGVCAIDTPPTWEVPEVVVSVRAYLDDFALYDGENRYLAFDHFGDAGIAYVDSIAPGDGFYARRVPGLGWVTDPALNFGIAPTATAQPSLAYDFSETPSVTTTSNPGDTNMTTGFFAAFDIIPWNSQILLEGDFALPDGFLSSSLAYDLLGRANTATVFTDIFNVLVGFRRDDDGDGSFEPGETTELVKFFMPRVVTTLSLSLAVDPITRPMMAIGIHDTSSPNPDQIFFAAKDIGQTWADVPLAINAQHPALAIDPDTGFPAVAYHNTAGDDLVYTQWNGDEWVFTFVDTAGSTGSWPSLAFDPADGNPAIAYHDSSGGDLRFAWHDGNEWNTQTVVDGTVSVPSGLTPSLAFNDFGTGFPAIAYFGIDSNLYFIEDPPRVGDLNDDGFVDVLDLLLLLAEWGATKSPADLNGDGVVDVLDLLTLLANWG